MTDKNIADTVAENENENEVIQYEGLIRPLIPTRCRTICSSRNVFSGNRPTC
jgi:hypothetical protein